MPSLERPAPLPFGIVTRNQIIRRMAAASSLAAEAEGGLYGEELLPLVGSGRVVPTTHSTAMMRAPTPQPRASSTRMSLVAGGKRLPAGILFLIVFLASTVAASAVEFNGSAVVSATATDNQGLESTLVNQQYNFSLFQRLTPYVRLRFGYSFLDLATSFEQGTDFSRRSTRPMRWIIWRRVRLALTTMPRLASGTSTPSSSTRGAATASSRPLRRSSRIDCRSLRGVSPVMISMATVGSSRTIA